MVKMSRKIPPHAGRCALERLDVARMIVRFDFENGRSSAVAHVHHAGVFLAGPLRTLEGPASASASR